MKRLAYITMPLWMVLLLFAMECLVSGVDLSVERDGDKVKVYTTNNTYRCAMFQWSMTSNTNDWYDYHGYFAGAMEPEPVKTLVFTVTANDQRVFWRLRDCATP